MSADPAAPPATPSSAAGWRRFLQVFAGVLAGLIAIALTLLFWANPYRNIPFAPTDRPLKDVNQRYLYPAVARDVRFDSAVFGTSSIRLLNPADLEAEFGGRFAELAMNNATAYEQTRIARLFLEIRAQQGLPVRTLIFGIDQVWCGRGDTYQRFTDNPFPPWMYDHDPWNDLLYIVNGKAVEIAARIVGWQLGLNPGEHYDSAGYANFLPPRSAYDPVRARKNIYGQATPRPIEAVEPPVRITGADRASWQFPTHPLMVDLLATVPAETRIIFAFVPYHVIQQPQPGSRRAVVYAECKGRFVAMAAQRPDAMVVDFMRPSPITTTDDNYWDPLHYGVETATLLATLLGRAARGKPDPAGRYVILYPEATATGTP
jgi:hypothetical protein